MVYVLFDCVFMIKFNNLKIYTTLGYIVSLILLNLGHVFRLLLNSSLIRSCSLPKHSTSVLNFQSGIWMASSFNSFTNLIRKYPFLPRFLHLWIKWRFFNNLVTISLEWQLVVSTQWVCMYYVLYVLKFIFDEFIL